MVRGLRIVHLKQGANIQIIVNYFLDLPLLCTNPIRN